MHVFSRQCSCAVVFYKGCMNISLVHKYQDNDEPIYSNPCLEIGLHIFIDEIQDNTYIHLVRHVNAEHLDVCHS